MAQTWLLNENISIEISQYFYIQFSCASTEFVQMDVGSIGAELRYYTDKTNSVVAYTHKGVWTDDVYRTVTFYTSPPDALLAWLNQNGVKQANPVNHVVVNGESILDLRSDTVTPETLKKGYKAHDKSGASIEGKLEELDTSDATVTAGALLEDVIAYGKDGKVVGTMPNNGTVSIEVSDLIAKDVSGGYYSGGTVKVADAEAVKIIPDNIKKGVTIFGVEGTLEAGNHLRFVYNNPADVSGFGNYVTIVAADETLKQVRSLDSLIVTYTAQAAVECTKTGCLWNTSDSAVMISTGTFGVTKRFNSTGEYSNSPQGFRADDDSNITAGSGRIYITEDGDLRIYGNTNTYPIRAGEIVVDVLW